MYFSDEAAHLAGLVAARKLLFVHRVRFAALLGTLMKLVCATPFHPCLSEAVDLRGAARKLLFVYGVEFAALLGIGGGSTISLAPLCGTT